MDPAPAVGPRWRRRPAIVGLLIGDLVVGVVLLTFLPVIAAAPSPTRRTTALGEMTEIRRAAAIFRTVTGRDPFTLDDLRRPLAGVADEGLLAVGDDPWGRPYVFERLGPGTFRILCLGADGGVGGEGKDADFGPRD